MASEDKKDVVILQTSRLKLRGACDEDLPDIFGMMSDGEVMRYWSWAPHTELDQTRDFLSKEIASPTRGTLNFVLVLSSEAENRDKDRVIGKAGIWSSSTPEIGFMLNRSYWGRGYMAEAFNVLLPHLWAQGFEKIIADVDPRNEGSIGILKKFGFEEARYERNTIETHLGWCDSLYMELTTPRKGPE